ncbi:ATPase involved in DNA replication HolB, small subunit [Halanaeroarchaeum sp. HSR-CO]|uniref:AAA family ATPase n=1 Tax=Halanaeroarchaeum sp. HSR-CO TaxID=2866382 RepID=UPI00217D3912|nr:AAA family ATPase [Halanaeroarchaeum sp. HSR-CO]UWG48974.1 ATPase involved in DNA replication HolB, small subunit [Halanaeroarchaeum sp. HSR-CO]
MEQPLWIDEYAPTLSELPQPDVRDRLQDAVGDPVNLVLHGPIGSAKTAAVRALAEAAHEDPDNDLIEINVADFFGMTKKEVAEDPRFTRFISSKRRRESSKADLINHVLKESASYPPVSGQYNTILLDNAEAIREDFQQALRRVMEQYHQATQFVITTRQPTKLIPPIRSRCFPVSVRSPTDAETVQVLERIVDAEAVEYDEEGLSFVASYGDGNLRKAILGAQTTAEAHGEITMETAYEALSDVGLDDRFEEMLDAAEAGEFTDARSVLDDLLVDEGLSGGEVLDQLLRVARARYDGRRLAELHRLAGEVEFDMSQGTSDRIHVGRLLAELGT